GNRSRRDGGRRSRPRKSWRVIDISCRSSKPDLDAPDGYAHQTVQRQLDLEGFSHSSREKPREYCEGIREFKYTARRMPIIIEHPKRKMKACQVIRNAHPRGEVKRDERFRKQTRRPHLH